MQERDHSPEKGTTQSQVPESAEQRRRRNFSEASDAATGNLKYALEIALQEIEERLLSTCEEEVDQLIEQSWPRVQSSAKHRIQQRLGEQLGHRLFQGFVPLETQVLVRLIQRVLASQKSLPLLPSKPETGQVPPLADVNPTAQPVRRDQFRVAIICALPHEADAVTLLFDQFWDEAGDPYGRAYGDTNVYTTGRIGRHNVVLTTLPNMGTISAAAATANLRLSYGNIKLALLVGICGGVPKISQQDAFLGDVVISKSIIQYDYGRQYPGRFVARNAVEDTLGRPNSNIRSILSHLETERGRELLRASSAKYLQNLQAAAQRKGRRAFYLYPGQSRDCLFPPNHLHRHYSDCDACSKGGDVTCETAAKDSCATTGCGEGRKVKRQRQLSGTVYAPEVFIGRIGSGNGVMKSGVDRDRIATEHNMVAFEMEGVGAWDEIPCMLVKGLCDYADSHKNKDWQDYAAATAASVARAIIDRYMVDNVVSSVINDEVESHR